MKQFIKRHDLWQRLLSIVLAFLLWAVVMNVDNPARVVTYRDITVTLTGRQDLMDRYGLSVIGDDVNTVTVRVSGQSKLVNDSTLRDRISATVNVSSYREAGEYDATPTVTVNRAGVEVQSVSPESVHFRLDKLETATVPVRIDTTGTPASGYRAGTATSQTKRVTVEGPAGDLEKVKYAYVVINVDNRNSTFEQDCVITLVGESGEALSLPYVSCQTASISVSQPILSVYTLPLNVTLKDGGEVRASQASVSISPERVQVVGDINTIEQMTEINLGDIDLGSVRTGTPITRSIATVLPEGVQLDEGQPTEAEITITVVGVETKNVEVTSADFVITDTAGEDSGYTVEPVTESVEIELRGSAAALEQVDGDSFSIGLTIDSASLGTGTHEVNGVVTATGLPSGVTLVEEGVQVRIRITKAEGGGSR